MDLKKIKKAHVINTKFNRAVCVKITPEMAAWVKKKDYSPTAIFREACKDLGYKGD